MSTDPLAVRLRFVALVTLLLVVALSWFAQGGVGVGLQECIVIPVVAVGSLLIDGMAPGASRLGH